MSNKIIISSILSIFSLNLLADNNYKDIEYLMDKERTRFTIEKLQNLKDKYDKNSEEYKILNSSQAYFVDKLPVDSFGTYTRMKLHNIIDEKQIVIKKQIPKYKILSPDTNLDTLYNAAITKEKAEQEMNKKTNTNNPKIPSNPFGQSNEELMNGLKKMHENNKMVDETLNKGETNE